MQISVKLIKQLSIQIIQYNKFNNYTDVYLYACIREVKSIIIIVNNCACVYCTSDNHTIHM